MVAELRNHTNIPWEEDDLDYEEYLNDQVLSSDVGFTNTHSHLDRALTIKKSQLTIAAQMSVQEKWSFVRDVKVNSTTSQIYDRMARVTDRLVGQGVRTIATFIDVDQYAKFKGLEAAFKLRETFVGIDIVLMNQVLEGLVREEPRRWFEEAAQAVDILGALPEKDVGHEREHIDIVFQTANRFGKMVHAHADQNGVPGERETEIIIEKVREHGMQGRVAIIHGISIAAQPKEYRDWLIPQLAEDRIMAIACPTGWLDRRRKEILAPVHNSFTPIDEMVPQGVVVALGTDNISDIYLPHNNGNMLREIVTLGIGTRFYNEVDELVKISGVNGRIALGLSPSRLQVVPTVERVA